MEIIIWPLIAAASEELFGVYQIGGGPDKGRRVVLILASPGVERDARYCWRSIAVLESGERDESLMETLKWAASGVVPARNI
mgnify:CR=1 FL=1